MTTALVKSTDNNLMNNIREYIKKNPTKQKGC